MRNARFAAALALVAAVAASVSTGGCQCNKTAPICTVPSPPPLPDTPTPWPTSAVVHQHVYVSISQIPPPNPLAGNIHYFEVFQGTWVTTPTANPIEITTAVPGLTGSFGGPLYFLAATESRDTLVEARTGSSSMAVFDMSSSGVNTAFSTRPISPSLGEISVARFAPPRGFFADNLFVANATPAPGAIQFYKFSGTNIASSGAFNFSGGVKDLDITPDGQSLAVIDTDNNFSVYKLAGLPPWVSASKGKLAIAGGALAVAAHANSWTIFIAAGPDANTGVSQLYYYDLYLRRLNHIPRTGGDVWSMIAEPTGRWLFLVEGSPPRQISTFDTTVTPPRQGMPISLSTVPSTICDQSSTGLWDVDYSPELQAMVASDLNATGPTAWYLDMKPFFASGGTVQPISYCITGSAPGFNPASSVRFGK